MPWIAGCPGTCCIVQSAWRLSKLIVLHSKLAVRYVGTESQYMGTHCGCCALQASSVESTTHIVCSLSLLLNQSRWLTAAAAGLLTTQHAVCALLSWAEEKAQNARSHSCCCLLLLTSPLSVVVCLPLPLHSKMFCVKSAGSHSTV